MNSTNHPLRSKQPETPRHTSIFRRRSSLSEKGMVSLTEAMIASLIVALLLGSGVYALRITERGTISQKRREQAYNLAKSKTEEIKAYINAQNWNQIQADVRFPPNAVPTTPPYLSYAPTTIQEGNNKFILSPTVRYVYSDSTSQLIFVNTPGTNQTPEVSNIVRIAVAGYYGPLAEFVPLPTVEASNLKKSQIVYTNFVSNKTIYVGSTGQVSGHVYVNCVASAPASLVEVGLYSGVLKISSALIDSSGYYQFNDVQEGQYSVSLVSAPGYSDGGPCTFTNPVSIAAGNNLSGMDVSAVPLPVWTYYGKVVYTSPVTIIPVPPTSPTPTPPASVTTAPVSTGAIVFVDDGNSTAVTAAADGSFAVSQVRATPVAGHPFDTIEADDDPTTQSGKNYNVGPSMYPYTLIGGVTYIGPITIYINQGITNRQSVTFCALDETYNTISGSYYPMTLTAYDASAAPPVTIFNNPTTIVSLNVHPGTPHLTLNMNNNSSPPAYINFDQNINVDAGVTTPVTLINLSVGTASGIIAGMGASFNYGQFYVTAQDDQGQYIYNIPVSYDGSATFGTFKYNYLRTPLANPTNGSLNYNFSAGGNSNYVSTTTTRNIQKGVSHALTDVIIVSSLNVYMAVTVTNNGTAYPYGSWVSAVLGTGATLPTTGLGNGFGISNYYSTITQGTGIGSMQVQLSSGVATAYTVFAQIVDPTTFATSTKSMTVTMTSADTFTSPRGVSFAFP